MVAAIVFPRSIYPLVLQFTLRRRTVDSAKKKKTERQISVRHDLFTRRSMTAYINSFTTPKAKGNVFTFDYFIKEMVNVAPVQPSNY